MKNRQWSARFIAASLCLSATVWATDQTGPAQTGATPQRRDLTVKSDQEVLSRAAHAFNDISKKASPAVVSITAVKAPRGGADTKLPLGIGPGSTGPGGNSGGGSGSGSGSNDDLPPGLFGGEGGQATGIGSGVIIRPDGLILTNNHVVENAQRLTVSFDDKHKGPAHLVGTDPKTDLALIKLDKPIDGVPKELPVLTFGDSDETKVGDFALAIGSPFGLTRTVTFGIISAKSRAQMGVLDIEDFIQTDAAINPGSSGGPLLNSRGELIGINTAIFSQGGGFMGIGFAIPSRIAKEISQELLQHGRVIRGWIGMTTQDLDDDLARYFGTPDQKGALVSNITPSGPASKASLKPGDVILKFDNQPVGSASQLKALVGKARSGVEVAMEIQREGSKESVKLVVREEPSARAAQLAGRIAQSSARQTKTPSSGLGLIVEDLSAEVSRLLALPGEGDKAGEASHGAQLPIPDSGALIVGVRSGSPAHDAGLQPGDVILRANSHDIHNAKDFSKVAKQFKASEPIVLYVQRGTEEKVFVPMRTMS